MDGVFVPWFAWGTWSMLQTKGVAIEWILNRSVVLFASNINVMQNRRKLVQDTIVKAKTLPIEVKMVHHYDWQPLSL